jgi:DNA-binding protein H-NS
MNLKSMSIDQLFSLRGQVDAALGTKVSNERRTLESKLASLSRFGRGATKSIGARGPKGPVAPKYRNPENPAETWAGRGPRPRWLAAAIKSGTKLEYFAIAAQARTAPVKRSRAKTRK